MNQPQQPPPPVIVLIAYPGSRLAELQASYDSVKAQYEEAKSRFDALTAALKEEMSAAVPPGATDVALDAPPGLPRLRLSWKSPYRFDAKRFRAERPDIYVRYEIRGGHWELRVAE